MFKKPTKEVYERLKSLDRDSRVAACKANPSLFSLYYFPHTKGYVFAFFHMLFFWAFTKLLNGKTWELLLFAFRESAKTSLVKEFVIYCIAYNVEDYIVWDSYDGGNSKRALFDIVVELQTNKRLIADFGEMYNAKRSMDEVTQKSVSDFVTNPVRNADGTIKFKGIRVEAHTTQEPARGFNHGGKRPGLVVLDDFENKKTIRSEALTLSIWEHIQELKGGLDSTGSKIIYLGNYISQFGNIQKLIDKMKTGVQGMEMFIVPVIGIILHAIDAISTTYGNADETTWQEKYVYTNAEAEAFALKYPDRKPRVSLEKKKKDMWTADTGDLDWECEMMQNPIDNTLAKFKREYFKNIPIEEVLRKNTACFVIIDPALSENDKSDDTGVSIIWTDELNNWYSKVFKVRINSVELVNFIFDINDYLVSIGTPPRKIGIEKEKYYGAVHPFLKREMQKRNVWLPMFAIEIKGRNKEDRITNALQYRYENGVIYHVTGEFTIGKDDEVKGSKQIKVPYLMSDYETQAQRFPAGGHDDMLDSHAYGSDIVRFDAPESEQEKKKHDNPYNIDAWVERIEKENRAKRLQQEAIDEARMYGYNPQDDQELPDEYFDEIGG